MTSHVFLLSSPVSIERLTWLEEALKFYFVQIFPESLMYRATPKTPLFTFLLTGDALASLENPETREIWSVILSLSAIEIVCDRQELDLRGISIEQIKVKNFNQFVDQNTVLPETGASFWNDVVLRVRQERPPSAPETTGWLQLESPYMHRSALHGLRYLFSGVYNHYSVELYAYLDGIHMGHISQKPADQENIGLSLEHLCDLAAKKELNCSLLACNRCATARGYSTWDDGKGAVISMCGIRSFKIRDMHAITDRFRKNQVILSDNAGSIQFPWKGSGPSFDRAELASTFPPVTILVTRSPYTTEHAYGAVAFAVACAHSGILTRVVFMEDGIYALTGDLHPTPDSVGYNIQDIINTVAGNENLHFFALNSSFTRRGTVKNKNLKAVLEIGYPGLGKILFYPPSNVQTEHQRILIF